ncbi:LysR family transcriptional regulator [Pseudomonas helleri]|uniref:LysR family transcriptional regulator n=1 Tax=Pseudomonas helleri TaxID=1608996 RepID=A0A6L5I2R6_9PSED|nr:LysR family transcriptional regulator [Pseudomonas helleri]MCR7873906.1 LysR family transcriptional regulator [Pseudomonas aeruginosa]MQU09497.1 LysR family transcriptional regulator [Pseudomonas helleri]
MEIGRRARGSHQQVRTTSPLDLASLHCFVLATEMPSLSVVAVELGQTQSSISKRIASLEQQLGGRLFERTGRGVVLTGLGAEVLPIARKLLADAASLAEYGKSRGQVPTGTVRIGLSSSFHFLVSDLFVEVSRRYSEVRLFMSEGFAPALEQELSHGRLDLATVTTFAPQDKSRDWDCVGIADTYLAGPATFGADSSDIDFIVLRSLPLALPPRSDPFRQKLETSARDLGIELQVAVEVNSTRMLLDLVSRTGIHTLLARHSVDAQLKANEISMRRLVNPVVQRHVTLRYATSQPNTLAVRVVGTLLREKLKSVLKQCY